MLSLNYKHVKHVKIIKDEKYYNVENLMKKFNNSKIGNGIYFKIAGWVDLDMLHIFAI
jgi:hypothetical protein